MRRYANKSGNAGIVAFEIGSDFIKIKFTDGNIYLYNYRSAGKENIEEMKLLARAGIGLTTFINKYVRMNYAEKLN